MDQNKVVSNTLLNEGKSSRLRALRKKAMADSVLVSESSVESVEIKALDRITKEEFLRCRGFVEKKLTDILKTYPAHKQARFFKIRFGISVDQLKVLPMKDICSVIGLAQLSFNSISTVAKLNYFGCIVEK